MHAAINITVLSFPLAHNKVPTKIIYTLPYLPSAKVFVIIKNGTDICVWSETWGKEETKSLQVT